MITLLQLSWRNLINQFRVPGKRAQNGVGIIFYLLFATFFSFVAGSVAFMYSDMVRALAPELLPAILAVILIVSFLIGFILALNIALARLYLSSPMELLMSLPIPLGTLLRWFVFEMTLMALPLGVLTIAAAAGYSLGAYATWPSFLAQAVIALMLIAIGVTVGLAAVIVLVRLIPAQSLKKILALAGVLLAVAYYIVVPGGDLRDYTNEPEFMPAMDEERRQQEFQQLMVRSLQKFEPTIKKLPTYTIAQAFALPPQAQGKWHKIQVIGATAGIGIAVWLIVQLLFTRTFYDNFGRVREYGRSRAGVTKQTRKSLFDIVPLGSDTVSRAIAIKDFATLFRDIRLLGQWVVPFFFLATMVYSLKLNFSQAQFVTANEVFMKGSLIILALPFALSQVAVLSFGREGRGMSFLKTLPITGQQLVRGKWLALATPLLLVTVLGTVILGLVTQTSLLYVVVTVLGASVLTLFMLWIAVVMGVLFANYASDDPKQAVSPGGGILSFVVSIWCFVWGLGLIGSLLALVNLGGVALSSIVILGAAGICLVGLLIGGAISYAFTLRAYAVLNRIDSV